MICEGLHLSSDMTIWPSIATIYTDLHQYNSSNRNRKQQGARFMTTHDNEALQQRMPLRTSQEVDQVLLQRTVNYRAGILGFDCCDDGTPLLPNTYDNSAIIPKERALNNPDMENEPLTERESIPQTKITHGLFRMFLFMDVIQGTDKAGEPKAMKVEAVSSRQIVCCCSVQRMLSCPPCAGEHDQSSSHHSRDRPPGGR